MFSIDELRHEATRCRRLAEVVLEPRTAAILREMAVEFDDKARLAEERSWREPANEDEPRAH